jgi:drug/metabolite transporter (DMT)-like permease
MSSGQKPHSNAAVIALAAAILLWATSFLAMKALGMHQEGLVPGVNGLFLAAASVVVRFAMAAILLAAWRGRDFARFTRLELLQGAGLGFFGGIGILLQMDGVMRIAASTSAFLTQGYCVWVPLAVALHRREWPSKTLAFSCAMVLGGVAVLSNARPSGLRLGRGEAETLAASLLFSAQILWLERPVFSGNRTVPVTLAMFVVVTLLVLPAAVFAGHGTREWAAVFNSKPAVGLAVFLALFCTLVPTMMMNYWQPRIPASHASLIYAAEPLITSVFALFIPAWLSRLAAVNYPNEAVGGRLLLGGGLVIAANILVLWRASRKHSEA